MWKSTDEAAEGKVWYAPRRPLSGAPPADREGTGGPQVMGSCQAGWPGGMPRGEGSLLQLFEASDDEVLVEGECLGEPKLSHHFKTHRVGERELLVAETLDPLRDRFIH